GEIRTLDVNARALPREQKRNTASPRLGPAVQSHFAERKTKELGAHEQRAASLYNSEEEERSSGFYGLHFCDSVDGESACLFRRFQQSERSQLPKVLSNRPSRPEKSRNVAVPTLAIVGRPNVGKSTLFNRLIGSRRSIVGDEPGITSDRFYGNAHWGSRLFGGIATGGILDVVDADMHTES